MTWFAVPTMTMTVSSSLTMLLSKLITFVAAAAGREYKSSSPRGEGFFLFSVWSVPSKRKAAATG